MIWAAFGHALQPQIVPMEGNPQSGRGGVSTWNYRQVIDQHVPGRMGYTSAISIQDNTTIHTTHTIRGWLHEHGYKVMPWTLYGPDLIPIETSRLS
jgi:hypothetical protein